MHTVTGCVGAMQGCTMPPKRAAAAMEQEAVDKVEVTIGYADVFIYILRFTNPALDDIRGPMACWMEVLKKLAEHLQLHIRTLTVYLKEVPAKYMYQRHASLMELALLKQLQVVGKEANKAMLVSFSSVAHMLQSKGMMNAAGSFTGARDMPQGHNISLAMQGPQLAAQKQRQEGDGPQAVVVQQHGEHGEHQVAELGAQDLMQHAPRSHDEAIQQMMDSSDFLEVGAPIIVEGALLDFPSVIPEFTGLPSMLGKKLGSLPDMKDPTLAKEMEALHVFHTSSINLHRDRRPVKEVTWENRSKAIQRYMGYCMHFHGKKPSPKLVLDIPLFAEFMGYVKAKHPTGAYLRDYCATATVVLQALPSSAYIKSAIKWLQSAGTQLNAETPFQPIDIPMLESQHKWIAGQQLVQAVHANEQVVMQIAQGLQGGKLATIEHAREVHDMGLASFLAGAHIAPSRSHVLGTLKHPDFKDTACTFSNCDIRGCKGNIMIRLQGGGLKLILPHHKNYDRWHKAVLSFELPEQLVQVLQPLVGWGSHMLRNQQVASVRHEYIFMSHDGRSSDHPSELFVKIVQNLCHDKDLHITCRMVRSIFVEMVREVPSSLGMQGLESGMAMHMGNSFDAWNKSYDLAFKHRDVNVAIKGMQSLREFLLAKPGTTEAAVASHAMGSVLDMPKHIEPEYIYVNHSDGDLDIDLDADVGSSSSHMPAIPVAKLPWLQLMGIKP